jgi:hypothetical protein
VSGADAASHTDNGVTKHEIEQNDYTQNRNITHILLPALPGIAEAASRPENRIIKHEDGRKDNQREKHVGEHNVSLRAVRNSQTSGCAVGNSQKLCAVKFSNDRMAERIINVKNM